MDILTQRGSRSQAKINVYVYMVSCLPASFQNRRTHISWNRHKNTHATALKHAGQKLGPWKNYTRKQSKKKKKSNSFIHAHRQRCIPKKQEDWRRNKWAFKDDVFKDPKYFIFTCIRKRILSCHFSIPILPCKKKKINIKDCFQGRKRCNICIWEQQISRTGSCACKYFQLCVGGTN